MSAQRLASLKAQRGFSMLEVIIVVVISVTIMAMALLSISSLMPGVHADAALDQVVSALRYARATAVSQRRDVQVQFLGNNQIQITRLEVPSGTTLLSTVTLGNNVQFTLEGMPDTPDGFGSTFPVDFGGLSGGPSVMMYQSDGTFVGNTGAPLNGSVFLGVPSQKATARAVTVLGATGRVRGYHPQGSAWIY